MAKIEVKGLWKVVFTEYERGWGQREAGSTEYYTTKEEAKARADKFNERNTEKYAPDWYQQAEYYKC